MYFGSSADCKVYALDADSGEERWSFMTEAPVRFAPTVWKDRVFAVSDDGMLYCLGSKTGEVLWTQRGAPGTEMLLGNDRMISRWPARGGPAVRDGILYFAAGIWPSEGIYLYALDAETGRIVWLNDSSGGIEMDQPHGGARAESGVSAQGYLVASEDRIFVPTGRAVAAAFRRSNGELEYFHLQKNGQLGGSPIASLGDYYFNAGVLFKAANGDRHLQPKAVTLAKTPDGVVYSTGKNIAAAKWIDTEKADRKGNLEPFRDLQELWNVEPPYAGACTAVAGDVVLSGGVDGFSLLRLEDGGALASHAIDGKAEGLAVANGKLYVSTDRGGILCFSGENTSDPRILRQPVDESPYGANAEYVKAAEEIVRKTGIAEGFCLDLGCGDGSLAFALAQRTKLQIYAVDSSQENVALARERLLAAGLYGVRVTVHHMDPAKTDYPDYFANLIVSGQAVTEGAEAVPGEEIARLQRPCGGALCIGKTGAMETRIRGELTGAGEWTHQYANPSNTGVSDDRIAKGPLGMLWFRDADQPMPQRHGRGPAPLYHGGRLFVEGMHSLRATDAYNGHTLWEYPLEGILASYNQDHLMGTAGTGSNFCFAGNSIYIRRDDSCLRIDAVTGEKLAEFKAPKGSNGKSGIWGYIACVDGTLYGSSVDDEHIVKWRYLEGNMQEQFTESNLFFAMDAMTGELKWKFTPKDSIRHNAIAIGAGRVYLIDRPKAEMDRLDFDEAKRRGKAEEQPVEHRLGRLLAIDAERGGIAWEAPDGVYGTMLALSLPHDVLLMSYQPTRFRLPSEIGGRMAALRASTGKTLWDIEAEYASRPLINDRTIYAQPSAWDLLTGEQKDFTFARSYGCGILSGSANLLLFRSATLGYRDLTSGGENKDYGGIRPGCWINAIPAGGLVLFPDAYGGCRCSYLIRASAALQAMN